MPNTEITIAILGAPEAGKTSLAEKYITGESSNTQEPGVYHVYTKEYTYESEVINLIINDTGGSADNEPERDVIIKKADGFIIVYDITKADTFNSVRNIRAYVMENGANKLLPAIIVGTKHDLEDHREVTNEQGTELAKEMQSTFFEVSAVAGDHVEDVFAKLVSEIQAMRNAEPKKVAKKGCCNLI